MSAARVTALEAELRARRACLEGASQTLESVRATLEQADTLESARAYMKPLIADRLELLELAIQQTDEALA